MLIRIILWPFFKVFHFFVYGRFYKFLINNFEFFAPLKYTRNTTETPVFMRQFLKFKVLGKASSVPYWPVHPTTTIRGSWRNVLVGVEANPGFSPGCYIQAVGKIYLGDYTQIAPNVGLISSNHFMLDVRKHIKGKIVIGSYCRIGMGSVILPNVVLGDFVTVAAGSVVTQSFSQGYCVIAGNPAKVIEDFSKNENIKAKFLRYKNEKEYNGFIEVEKFEEYRKKNLYI